jgi:Mg2+ and Co2+ transporter CorA
MKIYDVIKILGIITLSSLTITFVLGFFKINIKNRILIHKWAATITLILGFLHASFVLYITYF